MDMRSQVMSFVESMHDSDDQHYHYKLFKTAEVNPYPSCFAIYLKYMFGQLENMQEEEIRGWAEYFRGFQDQDSGIFSDPNAFNRVVDEKHDSDHLDMQFTTFCIQALDCLGIESKYPLKFLEPYHDQSYLNKWLNELDWSNSSNSGNKCMFVAICAIYDYEIFNNQKSKKLLSYWLDWMNNNQNSKTGFWGATKSTQYFNGILGFYHQFLIYNYLEKDLSYPDKVVDRCLFLQLSDGGFNPEYGGASCDDIDAIHTLVYLYHKYDYRRDDIRSALDKSLRLIKKNQNDDYGFCWSKHYWYDFRHYFNILYDLIVKRDLYYSYLCLRGLLRGQKKDFIKQKVVTGWSVNDRDERESSLFDTWFRVTTIALINTVLQKKDENYDVNFLKGPGLGWFDTSKIEIYKFK